MKNSFFKTKEGGLTIAFIIIMISFFLIQGGTCRRHECASIPGIYPGDRFYVIFTGQGVYHRQKKIRRLP